MKKHRLRLPDSWAVLLSLGALLALGVAAVCSGSGGFSDWERRYLADAPSAPNLASWKTDKETEVWLTDHIPFRQAFVAVDSTAQLLTGRRTRLNTWLAAGSVLEVPEEPQTRTLERRLGQFADLADSAGVPWLLLTPPTHGYLMRSRLSPLLRMQYECETESMDVLAACEQALSMPEAFLSDPDAMYYRTDHHWTLAGVWQAYIALGERLGYEPLASESFRLSSFPGFMGTTLSRSGLPPLLSDTLECAEPEASVTLTVLDDGSVHDRLIFPEAADTFDGYAVYLNGNHGLLQIENPAAEKGTLLVFKDSSANCLLPLISAHYSRIIAADARYMSGGFSEAVNLAGQPDAILYVYSLNSLLNDSEIGKKVRR